VRSGRCGLWRPTTSITLGTGRRSWYGRTGLARSLVTIARLVSRCPATDVAVSWSTAHLETVRRSTSATEVSWRVNERTWSATAPRSFAALRDVLRAGSPPLGPGGRPGERLHAYLDAMLDFVLDNRALILALENRRPNAYYANPASRFWIDELGRRIHATHPAADADYLAHAVFTALRADVIDYLRVDRAMSTDRIRAGLHALATPAS
jgi:hypothetical protein